MAHGSHASTKYVLTFADVSYSYGTIVRALQAAGAHATSRLVRTEPETASPSFRLLDANRTILCPVLTFTGQTEGSTPNGNRLEFGAAITLQRDNGDLSGTIVLTLTLREVSRVVISWSVDTHEPLLETDGRDWRVHVWEKPESDADALDAHALLQAIRDGIASSDVDELLGDRASLTARLERDQAFTRQITLEEVLSIVPALVALLGSA